jgi:hypothetical protein
VTVASKHSEGGVVLPIKNKLTFAYALSGLLAVVLPISSVAGLLYGGHGLYEPYPASLAGLVGQDAITLAVGLPLLIVSMWLTRHGSIRGLLLWAGTLFYFAYSYYFYVIGGFNALFLLYVAIISTSLYGMLSLLFAIDPDALKARFGARTPTRLVGGFLVGYSLLFALMWVGLTLASVVAGKPLDEVTHSVVAIDLTVLLPLLFFGGVWLWRNWAPGYTLAGALLTFMSVLALAIMAMMVSMGFYAQPVALGMAVLFGVVASASLGMVAWYLRGLE